MTRKRNDRGNRCSAPDHRPMLPEFRQPADVLEEAIRAHRRRREEFGSDRRMKWR